LVDLVVVVSREKKRVPTTEGMRNLKKSPFAEVRLQGMKNKLALCRQALHDRDLEKLGILAENEALEMHAVMITQQPPLLYWTPQTLELMKQVQDWRRSGLNCYFTINTGQNIHILCEEKDRVNVLEKLGATGLVKEIMTNYPAPGARIIE
jgi:diphosphomevalonate decarboxylase